MIKFIIGIMICLFVGIGLTDQGQQGVFNNDITLAWDTNTELNLAGYNVYVGLRSGGPYDLIETNEADNTEFTWHELPNNIDHYFVVTAFNDKGLESGYSNEVCGYADENHNKAIDCSDDYYTEDNDNSSGGGCGCFISVAGYLE